jgi:demethylmenaquinone methyltransferase/2-methoxy-6-polyprenyl-1,4-benzoquinol methylase
MAATKYPISTSTDEFTRLRVQADLFRNDARAMLMQIGDGAGLRVLDLCCGTGGITDVLSEWVGDTGRVVGADIDTAKLAHARQWAAKEALSNVEFIEANPFDSGLAPRSFDLVHTRFALSVIQNGLGILDHMLTLVRPAGVVFVE